MSSLMGDNNLFLKYVERNGLNSSKCWKLESSKIGGRGLFSSRKLLEGELIFKEFPLICGPRVDPKIPVCAGCLQATKTTCSKGCGLNVCNSKCENSELHLKECSILSKAKNMNVKEKLALSTALRATLLPEEDRNLINWLERHERPEHDKILLNVTDLINEEDLNTARSALQALDATAFEVPCSNGGKGSLRGLFPLGALMNHDCCPNTRHCFNDKGQMITEATRDIEEGEELSTTYTNLLWGNQSRQMHLSITKKFECSCQRCSDPSEFGANLMALYCLKKGCGKVVLPLKPGPQPSWGCASCGTILPAVKMEVLQNMVRNALQNLIHNDIRQSCEVLRKNTLVPNSNQAAVDFKLRLIDIYGHDMNFQLNDLSQSDLELKRLICIEILNLLDLLNLGKCRQRGLLLLELTATLNEMNRRGYQETDKLVYEMLPQYRTIKDLFNEGAIILHHDVTVKPLLLQARV